MVGVETKTKGGRPELQLFGKYEDKLVKTPEGWRIKERVWKADSFRGSMEESRRLRFRTIRKPTNPASRHSWARQPDNLPA
jgi:hypothetical protein